MGVETEMLQDYLERLSKEEPEVIFCHRMNETDRLWNLTSTAMTAWRRSAFCREN